MLFKTYEAFQDRLEYAKAKNGSWTVEFHGRFHVRAQDPSLDRCRHRALSALDEQLAAWIARPAARAHMSKDEKKPRKKRGGTQNADSSLAGRVPAQVVRVKRFGRQDL